jgi:hypothetical protein
MSIQRIYSSQILEKSVDHFGNKFYYTIGYRTLIKHAARLFNNPRYVPKTAGGPPSIINSAEGPEFIEYLRSEFLKVNRIGQNSMQLSEMNEFIVSRYKAKYFVNLQASVPSFSEKVLRKLRGAMKLKAGAAKYVSARRWEAMGDPRNYISWYVAATIAFKDVPLELRFNWDDTSLFVAGEQHGRGGACVGVAFTSEEVLKELAQLNRSPGMQAPVLGGAGKHCTPRMVQWGILASAAPRLEACVVKIYDRAISVADNMRLVFIKKVGDCDIHVLYIRGKQLAVGADPTTAEAIAHGGVDCEYANETDVAELVFTKVVAPKIESRIAQYAVAMDQIRQVGFKEKLSSPELQQKVTEQLNAMRANRAMDPFAPVPSAAAAAPVPSEAAAAPVPSEAAAGGDSDSDSSSAHSSSSSDAGVDSDDADYPQPGLGDVESCAHLPPELTVPQHEHKIFKKEATSAYVCGVCGGRDGGGMVYACRQLGCGGWCAHLRCVLPADLELDTSMLLSGTALAQLRSSYSTNNPYSLRAVLSMDGCNGQVIYYFRANVSVSFTL